MKFEIRVFFENLSRKFKFGYNMTKVLGTSHDTLCTFMIISRRSFLRMRNVQGRRCTENQNTHFMLNTFFIENRAVYKTM